MDAELLGFLEISFGIVSKNGLFRADPQLLHEIFKALRRGLTVADLIRDKTDIEVLRQVE